MQGTRKDGPPASSLGTGSATVAFQTGETGTDRLAWQTAHRGSGLRHDKFGQWFC